MMAIMMMMMMMMMMIDFRFVELITFHKERVVIPTYDDDGLISPLPCLCTVY